TQRLVVDVDRDLVEEGIDRGPQFRHRHERDGEVFPYDGLPRVGLGDADRGGERLLLGGPIEFGGGRARIGRAVLLLLDADDVDRTLVAGEQVLAIVGVEEFAQRLDAADDQDEIVLALEGKHGVDEVVPRALIAQLDLHPVVEEGNQRSNNSFDISMNVFACFPPQSSVVFPISRTECRLDCLSPRGVSKFQKIPNHKELLKEGVINVVMGQLFCTRGLYFSVVREGGLSDAMVRQDRSRKPNTEKLLKIGNINALRREISCPKNIVQAFNLISLLQQILLKMSEGHCRK